MILQSKFAIELNVEWGVTYLTGLTAIGSVYIWATHGFYSHHIPLVHTLVDVRIVTRAPSLHDSLDLLSFEIQRARYY